MIESKHEMTEAKEGIEDRTPEGHDPNDERGGDGTRGEAGAMPGVPASEWATRRATKRGTRATATRQTTSPATRTPKRAPASASRSP